MQLPAKIDQWESVYEKLESTLELSGISEKTKYEIYVSAEEIFTNIASYAYDTEEGMVEIDNPYHERMLNLVNYFFICYWEPVLDFVITKDLLFCTINVNALK